MIRVKQGLLFAHNLGPFHSATEVTEGFSIPVLDSKDPPIKGVFGTDKADPQPDPYPAGTTFYVRGYSPLVQGSSVSIGYLSISMYPSGLSLTVNRNFSGTVRKVWDVPIGLNFSRNLATDENPFNFIIRHKDSGNELKAYTAGSSTSITPIVVFLPTSSNPLPNTTFNPVPCNIIRVVINPSFDSFSVETLYEPSYVVVTKAGVTGLNSLPQVTLLYVFPSL